MTKCRVCGLNILEDKIHQHRLRHTTRGYRVARLRTIKELALRGVRWWGDRDEEGNRFEFPISAIQLWHSILERRHGMQDRPVLTALVDSYRTTPEQRLGQHIFNALHEHFEFKPRKAPSVRWLSRLDDDEFTAALNHYSGKDFLAKVPPKEDADASDG